MVHCAMFYHQSVGQQTICKHIIIATVLLIFVLYFENKKCQIVASSLLTHSFIYLRHEILLHPIFLKSRKFAL